MLTPVGERRVRSRIWGDRPSGRVNASRDHNIAPSEPALRNRFAKRQRGGGGWGGRGGWGGGGGWEGGWGGGGGGEVTVTQTQPQQTETQTVVITTGKTHQPPVS